MKHFAFTRYQNKMCGYDALTVSVHFNWWLHVVLPSISSTLHSGRYDVREDITPGQQIAKIAATDPDKGNNKVLEYSIVPSVQGAQLPISINSSSGVLTNTARLDRESTARYCTHFVVISYLYIHIYTQPADNAMFWGLISG